MMEEVLTFDKEISQDVFIACDAKGNPIYGTLGRTKILVLSSFPLHILPEGVEIIPATYKWTVTKRDEQPTPS